jgi:uncharacterized protein YyaL (SSP411 family)
MVSAWLLAGEALSADEVTRFALKTLDRLLAQAVDAKRGAAHVIEPDGTVLWACLAADEAALALACEDAFVATGDQRYLTAAGFGLARLDERFRDPRDGAYFDRAAVAHGAGRGELVGVPEALSRLKDPHQPCEDAPGPSLNALVAQAHLRYAALTGDDQHAQTARKVLEAFGSVLEALSSQAAALTFTTDAAARGPVFVVVPGSPGEARTKAQEFLQEAARAYAPYKLIIRGAAGAQTMMPPRLRAKLPAAGSPAAAYLITGDQPVAVVPEPAQLRAALARAVQTPRER